MTFLKIRVLTFFVLTVALSACERQAANPVIAEHPGQAIVKNNCKVCHAQGINGAPIIGNIKMWSPRLQKDTNTLVTHAMEGFGLMPAKGGNNDLSENEIRLAVDFMLSQLTNSTED